MSDNFFTYLLAIFSLIFWTIVYIAFDFVYILYCVEDYSP